MPLFEFQNVPIPFWKVHGKFKFLWVGIFIKLKKKDGHLRIGVITILDAVTSGVKVVKFKNDKYSYYNLSYKFTLMRICFQLNHVINL